MRPDVNQAMKPRISTYFAHEISMSHQERLHQVNRFPKIIVDYVFLNIRIKSKLPSPSPLLCKDDGQCGYKELLVE
jgi:hypothetical protein